MIGRSAQNDKSADEITRNILQSEAYPDANRAGKNGQRFEVNAGVLQDNENADDEDNIGSDLRDRVLKRAIETAVNEEAIKEKTLRPRRNPKDQDKQANEEKNLQQADRNPGYRRTPGEGNAEAR